MADIDKNKKIIADKIEDGTFSGADLGKYFVLFCEIGKNSDDFQDEIEEWNRNILFEIEGLDKFWITTENGNINTGTGDLESIDLTLKINLQNVLKIFSSALDPGVAFMTGKLRVKGELPDALKFSELMEIVAEEIEYN